MAKKKSEAPVAPAGPCIAMGPSDEEYRVRDARDTIMRYEDVCRDKPLHRKAMRSIKRAANRGARR